MTVDARIVFRFMGRLGDIVLRKYACCVRCWEDVGGLQRVVFREFQRKIYLRDSMKVNPVLK